MTEIDELNVDSKPKPEGHRLFLNDALLQTQLTISNWTPEIADEIYEKLEHPNWAPWLEASQTTIAGRANVFKQGQLLIVDNGTMAASLSMNRINWDGNPDTLPSWDQVAGQKTTDYSETYKFNGNTLVLMSMNVAPSHYGQQLPAKLIENVKAFAQKNEIDHLIGSFRPSGYGKAKKEFSYQLPFWDYCQMKIPGTDKPVDPWLRSLWWSGMEMIKEDDNAMLVKVTHSELMEYMQNYHPESWVQINQDAGVQHWECGEVGSWMVGMSSWYRESNVWGKIPLK